MNSSWSVEVFIESLTILEAKISRKLYSLRMKKMQRKGKIHSQSIRQTKDEFIKIKVIKSAA